MIPFATTTITVQREEVAVDTDGYDDDLPDPTTVVSGVRAVIGPPSANVVLSGGDRVVYSAQLRCDPCDIQADDTVVDASNDDTWVVLWARRVTALGLDFMEAQLRLTTGVT